MLVRLAAVDGSSISSPLRVNHRPDGGAGKCCTFVTDSGGALRIRANRGVDTDGQSGPWAQFFVDEEAENRSIFRLRSVGHAQKGRTIFLEATPDAFKSTEISTGSGTRFQVVPASDGALAPSSELGQCRVADMALSVDQKAAFSRDGFLVVRNAVPQLLVDDALRAINNSLAQPQDSGQVAVPELLVNSPALSLAEQLLGPSVSIKNPTGQIALRFPLSPAEARMHGAKGDDQWHIDSMYKMAHMSEFQLLVGVALSAQPDDDFGNLHVWPGRHVTVHDAVRKARQHPDAMPATYTVSDNGNFWCGLRPQLPAAERQQVQLQPGDVVLKHQKLPHSVGLNRSPHIRYQVYFRLSATDFSPTEAPLLGLFHGWHGLAPQLPESGEEGSLDTDAPMVL